MTPRPSENRIEEALDTGADHFTVACPKDMSMYSDAVKTSGNEENMQVRDLVDYVADAMELEWFKNDEPSEASSDQMVN